MIPEEVEHAPIKDEEPFGLGCALELFTEHEEVLAMIENLPKIVDAERSVIERAHERFVFILNQYIEQPHLIDSHLGDILEKMIGIIRAEESSLKVKNLVFKYMFVVVNVRGYKVIVRQLPHEVADFEPVLQLLEQQDPEDSDNWTTRYILLLWLSIIVMIPFHMSRFDGFDKGEELTGKPVMTRVLDIIKTYCVVPDKCRDAAAYLSYKFLTRQDVKELHLASFLDWTMEVSSAPTSGIFAKYGTLACIAMILKHGKRDDLLPHTRRLLEFIVNDDFKKNFGSNVQKLVFKIVQRIGLTFLPPRIAPWRYKRGNRSLQANLCAGDGGLANQPAINNVGVMENEANDVEVPDEVEEVIDQLIQGLRSTDGVVRWSAAKGIGRVTGRLPKDLADEVVGSVLELFSPRESDGAWHGGCLSLAELGRRGLLLPERLPQVVPLVTRALVYDEPRGYSSVGSHIRDAACYVCWSFARAYETADMTPFVPQIASTLLVVTCFDKEINCRRAASAAFQENVGRQGGFPHGIDILTTADFFAVSVRNNAYLNVSVYIAQFDEYTIPLITHLLERKVDHWDSDIRELTAKALYNLTPKAPKYMVETILPRLFEKTLSIDLNNRHGAVLAIGYILQSLGDLPSKPDLPDNLIELTRNLISTFKEKLYFRGLGGELMKQACACFIEKCALARLPFHGQSTPDEWLELLNDCIAYKTQTFNIRTAAIQALPIVLSEYFSTPDSHQKTNDLFRKYIKELQSTNLEVNRMSHALALGAMPKFILLDNLDTVILALIESLIVSGVTAKWAESRRDAIKALAQISSTLSEELTKEFSVELVLKVYQVFLDGLKDYTQDNRGDIGAWVREASMSGLQSVTVLVVKQDPSILSCDLMTNILSGIAQQAVGKIDRTRALAGKAFYNIIYIEPKINNILYYDEIKTLFPESLCEVLNWNSAASTFPKFVQLLDYPEYSYNVLVGFVCSVGGMTETLVKNSSHALYTYLKTKSIEEINRICELIYRIFVDYQKVDRISVPMFRFIDKLFDSGCINVVIEDTNSDFCKRVLKLIQMEIVNCKDIYKLIDGINVLCQFIQVQGTVCDTALTQLSMLLCHRQPYVRRSTSTKLYESLLCYGSSSNIDPEKLDDAMELLSNTNWEENIDVIRPIRNDLCELMGIKAPVLKKKP